MAAIGYVLNKTTDKNAINTSGKKRPFPINEQPSMNNAYESSYTNNTLAEIEARGDRMYQLSKDPKQNRVISRNYNLLKETGGGSNDNESQQKKIKSLTGALLDKENFTHNNMVPFFGGSVRQNVEPFANSTVLMNQNGTNDLYKQKKETPSFYDKCQDIGNINGMANKNDYYRDRIAEPIVRNNIFPIEKINVGPGINRGYSASPDGGYQQFDIRESVMPKTVDELRIESNPKKTYDGKILDGMKAKMRGDVGTFDKNRPDTFYEQTPDMWLRTTGAFTKQMENPEQIVKDTNRQDIKSDYIGVAYGQDQKKRVHDPSVRMARKPQLEKFDLGNASLVSQGAKEKFDYGKANILVYKNERDVTSTKVYQGNLTSMIKSIIAPIADMIKVTKKDDMIDNPRHFGNVNVQIPDKPTMYDPNDIARTTLKEQTIHDAIIGNLKGNEKQTIYDPNDVTRTTLKEQLIHDSVVGNLKGNEKQTVHDPNDVTRTTIKEQLIHDSVIGNLKGNEKQKIYDPNDISRTTLKEQLIHDSSITNLTGPIQLTIYDPDEIAKITTRETMKCVDTKINLKGHVSNQVYNEEEAKNTLKQTLIDLDRFGNTDRFTGGLGGNAYETTEWDVKRTQKEILSDNDYFGQAMKDRGLGYETNDYEARMTQKQLLSDNDYYGVAAALEKKKPTSMEDIKNMTIRPNIESVLKGREPTLSGKKTFNASEYIAMSNRKEECDMRTVRETPAREKVYNEIPSTDEVALTKMKKNYKQIENERLDISVLKATLENPLNINISANLSRV